MTISCMLSHLLTCSNL